VQLTSEGLGSFRAGWATMAVFALVSGVISVWQPRQRSDASVA